MDTTYFGLLPTYLLLISFKITTILLLLSGNIGKVAELWTLGLRAYIEAAVFDKIINVLNFQ